MGWSSWDCLLAAPILLGLDQPAYLAYLVWVINTNFGLLSLAFRMDTTQEHTHCTTPTRDARLPNSLRQTRKKLHAGCSNCSHPTDEKSLDCVWQLVMAS